MSNNPQMVLMSVARESESSKVGMINARAKINFDRNVKAVDSHISLVVCLFSNSSEMCMPSASESASETAIISIPPMTTSFELVLEPSPIIRPSVVMIPEVSPNPRPFLIDSFIKSLQNDNIGHAPSFPANKLLGSHFVKDSGYFHF